VVVAHKLENKTRDSCMDGVWWTAAMIAHMKSSDSYGEVQKLEKKMRDSRMVSAWWGAAIYDC
jgi:hypothetical protein